MIFGRSVISWLIGIFVAICVFVIFRWLIPVIFALVGVAIPDQVVTVLCLLIAVGAFYYARIP